jgi:hypothetical protein
VNSWTSRRSVSCEAARQPREVVVPTPPAAPGTDAVVRVPAGRGGHSSVRGVRSRSRRGPRAGLRRLAPVRPTCDESHNRRRGPRHMPYAPTSWRSNRSVSSPRTRAIAPAIGAPAWPLTARRCRSACLFRDTMGTRSVIGPQAALPKPANCRRFR